VTACAAAAAPSARTCLRIAGRIGTRQICASSPVSRPSLEEPRSARSSASHSASAPAHSASAPMCFRVYWGGVGQGSGARDMQLRG
jgi:hypothetical protein